MDKEILRIYVDRLKEGSSQSICETCPSEVMDVNDDEMKFTHPVTIQGEAYLADSEVIIHINVDTKVTLRCSYCDEWKSLPLSLKDLYCTFPLEEAKSGIYDFAPGLREEILIESPKCYECKDPECPNKQEVKKHLENGTNVQQYPFKEL